MSVQIPLSTIYYQKNKERLRLYARVAYQKNKEKIKERQRKWRTEHLERLREKSRNWQRKNRGRFKEYHKKWYVTHKEHLRQYRIAHPEVQKKYVAKHPEAVLKIQAKHRKLGFIPLNQPFQESEAHHIDKAHTVWIPKKLHKSVRHNVWNGHNMEKINSLTFKWLQETTNTLPLIAEELSERTW